MIKVTLLLLLSLASIASAWGVVSDAPKTCTKYASTEDIIKARKDKVSLKTNGRAPVCTNDYSFTFVKPDSSMTFNSGVKKWMTPKKINCGLWFWTKNGYKFNVECSIIDVNKEDKMVIFDIDNDKMNSKTGISVTNEKFSFESKNVAIGLEMQVQRKKPSYCCKITSVKATTKSYFVGGDTGKTGSGSTDKADLVAEGKVTTLSTLPKATRANTLVVYTGQLFTCGGASNEKTCLSLDLRESSPTWKSTTIVLPVSASVTPMMVVGDYLWVLNAKKIYTVPFKSGSAMGTFDLPTDLDVGKYPCGGSDEVCRFVIPDKTSDVWINTNSQKPAVWTKTKVTLKSVATKRACMLRGEGIYVTGGQLVKDGKFTDHLKDAEMISVKDFEKKELGDMVGERRMHAMGVLEDKIAVFGGSDGTDRLETVEVFKAADNKWEKNALKLTGEHLSALGYVTIN